MHDNSQNGDAKRVAFDDAALKRPRELEDWLNFYLYHPLSWRIAKSLSRTAVTPNLVSLAGGLSVVTCAYFYTIPSWPQAVIIGLLAHMLWHVLDGADGDLARINGKVSPNGEIVDGLSDYLSHIILYCMMAHLLAAGLGSAVAWAVVITAGLSRIVQANFYEVRRRQYQLWVYNRGWLKQFSQHDISPGIGLSIVAQMYLRLSQHELAADRSIDSALSAAQRNPKAQRNVREAIIRHHRPLLGPLGLLSANHRTIFLGLAMLSGEALWYFLYEIILLNAALIWLKIRFIRADRAMEAELLTLDGSPRSARR
jgi:phosphatidylglycerophosphate synthase